MRDPISGHEIELTPVQTIADGLTFEESAAAYRALSEHFNLRGPQRSKLDRSACYSVALNAAHRGDWRTASRALGRGGIIE